MTSSGQREYVVAAGTANQTLSYRLRQNITFSGCPHSRLPAWQQLSVARAFALFDNHEHVLRYALAARIGPARGERQHPPPGANPGAIPGANPGCQPPVGMPPSPKAAVCSLCPKSARKEGFSKQFELQQSWHGGGGTAVVPFMGYKRGWSLPVSPRSLIAPYVPLCPQTMPRIPG